MARVSCLLGRRSPVDADANLTPRRGIRPEEQLGEGRGGTLASCTSLTVTVAGALRCRLRALLTIRTFRDC